MNRFTVAGGMVPTGDQPQAIEQLAENILRGAPAQTLLGVTGSGKTFTMARVIERAQRPALVIAPNKTLAAQLYGEFRAFFPENAVEYFVSYYDYYQPEAYVPSTDTYIAKDAQINDTIDKMRHSATRSLLDRRDVVIVASVSCIYGLGSPQSYKAMLLSLERGLAVPREQVLRKLVEIQYERNEEDFHRGTFRVRGDVLEIFPAYEEDRAVRIEFFGDEVDEIREFDPLTGATLRRLERVTVYPGSHYVTERKNLERAVRDIAEELEITLDVLRGEGKLLEAQRIEERTRFDLEMLRELGYCSGIENYSRHLDGRRAGEPPATLLDYFPEDFILFVDESHVTVPQLRGMYRGDRSRKETLVRYGFRLPSALDNRPLSFEEFTERVRQVVFVSATPGPYELDHTEGRVAEQIIRPTGLVDPEVEVRPADHQVDDLIGEIRKVVAKGRRVLVTTLTKRMAEDLTEYLADLNLRVRYMHADVDTVERIELVRDLRLGDYDVLVGINLLREGLDIPEVTLVAILDADSEGFLRSERSIIQTSGRAARNVEGRVILYANTVTDSMRRAMSEMSRRRAIQAAWNLEHGITPRTIEKDVTDILAPYRARDAAPGRGASAPAPGEEMSAPLEERIRDLERRMKEAAAELRFEQAAALRDRVVELKRELLAVWR